MHIFVKSQTRFPKLERDSNNKMKHSLPAPWGNTQFCREAGPCRPSPDSLSGQAEGKRASWCLDVSFFNRKKKRKKLSTIKGCKLHID